LRDVIVGQVDRIVVLRRRQDCLHVRTCSTDSLAQLPCSQWRRSCGLEITKSISIQPSSVAPVLFDAPRRSSSRSVRQLMKERELLMRSVVSLMLAIFYSVSVRVDGKKGVVGCRDM
jgi:hypothetical protein